MKAFLPALATLSLLTSTGCSLFERQVRPLDDVGVPSSMLSVPKEPPSSLVWRTALLPVCLGDEVEAAATQESTGGIVLALGELFLGKSIDYLVSAFAQAASDAARRDRDGMTFATTSPEFLFTSTLNWDGEPSIEPTEATLRTQHLLKRCLVIARGRQSASDSGPPDWCGEGTCSGKEIVHFDQVANALALHSPSFYAEIRLLASPTRTTFRGELAYLYYPRELTARKGETRDLLLTAILQQPSASPDIGAPIATFAFAIKDIKPGTHWHSAGYLGTSVTGWSPLPETPNPADLLVVAKARQKLYLDNSGRVLLNGEQALPLGSDNNIDPNVLSYTRDNKIWTYKLPTVPLTVRATVQETGDVNRFLQYMAEWLSTDQAKAAIATPLRSALLPSQREAAEAAQQAHSVALSTTYNAALDTYLTKRKSYQDVCEAASAPLLGAARTTADAAYLMYERAYSALLRAAAEARITPPLNIVVAPDRCELHQ